MPRLLALATHRPLNRVTVKLRPHVLRGAVGAAAVVLALGSAPTAVQAAASVTSAQGLITYRTDPGDINSLVVGLTANGSEYVFTDFVTVSGDGACTGNHCPVTGVRKIQIWLGDRGDTLTIQDAASPPGPAGTLGSLTAMGGDGTDVLTGGSGPEQLTGGPGIDFVNGGGGADVLDFPIVDQNRPPGAAEEAATPGVDTLDGGPGDDRLNGGPAGANQEPDNLIGGADFDTADYSQRTAPLSIALDDVANDGQAGENDNVSSTVEKVISGDGNDSLLGSSAPNVLDGANGDDRIVGLDGDDILDGGQNTPGDDTLDGGNGADCLYGRAGDDQLDGGDGPDCMFGAGGSDSLRGEGADDMLAGGAGTDMLDGGDGNDSLDGAEPNLVGGDGADTLNGGSGADTLLGQAGDDRLNGGLGPDVMRGGPDRDTVTYEGRNGDVTVTLNDRDDDGEDGERDNVASDVEVVLGGTLDDTLTGDRDPNTLAGGSGQDLVIGNPGGDVLTGGSAPDVIRSRDGERDEVDCGDDGDLAVVDAEDKPRNCATVDKPSTRTATFARWLVVRPVGPEFGLELPRGSREFDMPDPVKVPVGSTIDPDDGVRLITAGNRAGNRVEISVSGGRFSVRQTRSRPSDTQLRLRVPAPTRCGGSSGRRRAGGRNSSRRVLVTVRNRAKRKKPPRKRVEVRGKHSIAAAEGTRWMTEERCDGTLTRVDSGTVRVRDLELRKTVIVRAGHRYLARAR
jgi:Ca2+-binding RTX toxin-like protein